MPSTKSRTNTNVMYATRGGQGMAIMGATSLGKDATAAKMTPAFTPTRRAATHVRMTRAN